MPGATDYLDILTGVPLVGPQGTIRIARQGGILVASVDGAAFVPVGQEGAGAAEAALAQSLIGPGANGLLSVFHPTAAHLQAGAAFFSTGSVTATVGAGFYRLSTTAVAAQNANLVPAAPGRSSFCRVGQSWFTSARFAASTAVSAQTKVAGGLYDTSNVAQASMGVNGSVSASFFSLQGGTGGNIITTIAIDTAVHTHRAWRTGGVTYYQIDGGTIFTGTSDLSAPASPGWNLDDGSDATNRAIDMVWLSASAPAL